MARSPETDREALLAAAVRRATEALRAPVDTVAVEPERIVCTAGRNSVELSYRFASGGALDASTGQLVPHPDGGRWQVAVIGERAARTPEQIGRGFAKFLKKRGW